MATNAGVVAGDMFAFNWTIRNFKFCFQNCKEAIYSPHFKNGTTGTWQIAIYPRGILDTKEEDSHISCSLHQVQCENEVKIKFCFQIFGVPHSNKCSSVCKFNPNHKKYGFGTFISRQTLFENEDLYFIKDDLIIQCGIWKVESKVLDGNLIQKFFNQHSEAELTELELLDEEIASLVSELKIESKKKPIARFSHSEISVHGASFEFFGKLECNKFASIFIESPPLMLSIKFADSANKKILIRIRRMKNQNLKLLSASFASCYVFLLGNFKKILQKEEFRYFFNESNEKVWEIYLDTTSKKFNINENVHLKFDYMASTGEVKHDIKDGWHYGPLGPFPQIENEPKNAGEMSEFYDKQKLCDLKLICADGKQLHAHKMVLCMGSPVFKAMFNHDMKENRENKVEIDDFSSTTVDLLLKFFYSGQYPTLEWSEALDLLAAADKYQVSKLVDYCSNLLRNQLVVSNVCDILLEADRCNDTELKIAALDFTCCNLSEVLRSKGWKTLYNINSELSSEIMKYVAEKFGK